MSTKAWPEVFKGIASAVKKHAAWPGEPGRVLETRTTMKYAYWSDLASRAHFPMDVEGEQRERAQLRREFLGWDTEKKRWTSANGLKRKLEEFDRLTAEAKSLDSKAFEEGMLAVLTSPILV